MTHCRTRQVLRGIAAFLLAACSRETPRATSDTQAAASDARLVLFNAGSLTAALRTALDTIALQEKFTLEAEPAGSLETARKLTELHRIPDIIALADYEVFPQLLMPSHVSWYLQFARNRMVLAYTEKSRGASEINADNWWRVVTRAGVEVGRGDPNLDPAGYRALMVWQLAERHYKHPGLAKQFVTTSGPRNVRPKSADLVALLQTHDLDYAWEYESVALQAGLKYLRLPSQIDLGSPADSAAYATALVRVAGRTPLDTIELRGEPIVYALSIPREAPHPALAERVVAWLMSADGRRVLRAKQLDVLDTMSVVGSGAPASIIAGVAR